ncbi:ABC transporter substrate-binding protein [Bacillus dakarensis]|uniref:ABC transporter substrate-binding protein n=1 Tax=Robertmurraya dakarensis TaxID=1926278 RepID=UPI000980C2CE|nr:ABC transporter substrate-binding protein [Bacillus dakarensis]
MVRKNRVIVVLFLLICSAFIAAGCTNEESATETETDTKATAGGDGEKVLKVGLPSSPGNIDPHFATTHVEYEVVQPIFNGLMRFQPGTASFETIEGDLAESWEVSDDGLAWTFKLRKGVQWQKGYGEFTSADVKYSFERIMDPKVGSSQRTLFKYVKEIETPDDYTVILHLTQPYPSLPVSLVVDGLAAGAIVKKEAIESEGDAVDKLVGTGPFALESYSPGEKAVLTKHEDYFRGEPKLDKIEMTVMRDLTAREVALVNGDIHMTIGDADKLWLERMSKEEDLIIEATGSYNVSYFHMNVNIPPLDDIRVRKAIAHAIDFESYRKSMYDEDIAVPLTSVLSDDAYGHADIGKVEYNPELSKKLLAEAGYPDGIKIPKTLTPNVDAYIRANSFIQEQLRQVGIEVPMEQVDLPTWIPAIYGQKNSVNFQTGVTRVHGIVHLHRVWHSEGNANFTGYSGSDELLERAEAEMEEEKALELYKQAQQEIFDAYVSIPILAGKQINVRRKEVDLGYELKATGIYMAPKYETTDLK